VPFGPVVLDYLTHARLQGRLETDYPATLTASPGPPNADTDRPVTSIYTGLSRNYFASRMSTKITYRPVALFEKGDITASVFRVAAASEPAAPVRAQI